MSSSAIPFHLLDMDCEPFAHGSGENRSNGKLTLGIWYMEITDMACHRENIRFYVTEGNGIPLPRKEILRKSHETRPESLFVIPPKRARPVRHEINVADVF